MSDETSIKELFQGMIPESMGIIKGKVISDNPLEIQILNDEKLILRKNNICLPKHLTNYTVTVDITLGEGESAGTLESSTKTGQGTHPHGSSGEHPHSEGTHPHGDSGGHEHILSGGGHEHITPEETIGGGNHEHELIGGSHGHPNTEGAHEHPDTQGKHSHPDNEGAHVHDLSGFNIYKATMKFYNALKTGDTVYILSFNGGKKYYILDKED